MAGKSQRIEAAGASTQTWRSPSPFRNQGSIRMRYRRAGAVGIMQLMPGTGPRTWESIRTISRIRKRIFRAASNTSSSSSQPSATSPKRWRPTIGRPGMSPSPWQPGEQITWPSRASSSADAASSSAHARRRRARLRSIHTAGTTLETGAEELRLLEHRSNCAGDRYRRPAAFRLKQPRNALLHRRRRPVREAETRSPRRDRRTPHCQPYIPPSAAHRQDRGQGYQPLRRRGVEGLFGSLTLEATTDTPVFFSQAFTAGRKSQSTAFR